ncbi:TPA: hypothetical protein QH957_004228 [Enterobacter bugandensis]|nr:hypothetical protein [Enterobacter bugandensis]
MYAQKSSQRQRSSRAEIYGPSSSQNYDSDFDTVCLSERPVLMGGAAVAEEALEGMNNPPEERLRLIGFHGTTEDAARSIRDSGPNDKIFFTDSYANAWHYAQQSSAYGGKPKVLSAYIRNSYGSKISTDHYKGNNVSFKPEVTLSKDTVRQHVRWQSAAEGEEMNDFHQFWPERFQNPTQISPDDLARLQNIARKREDRNGSRAGCFNFLRCFRRK